MLDLSTAKTHYHAQKRLPYIEPEESSSYSSYQFISILFNIILEDI
jgi:hypothetical protein